MKYLFLILCTFYLITSCGIQQKTVENSTKEMTPELHESTVDSVNAQHDKIAEGDALNTTKTATHTESTEVYINIFCVGYAPLEVEEKITVPIENTLKTLEYLDEITATSEEDYSKTIVLFNPGISKEEAITIVQQKVNQLIENGSLPKIVNKKFSLKITSHNNFDEKFRYNYATNRIESKKIVDSVLFINNAKFTTSTDSIRFNNGQMAADVKILTPEKNVVFNHQIFNDLLKKHVTKDGVVNYKGFKANRTELQKYINSLGENMPTDTWSKEEKLAYWINAYNALTVDLILRNYPLKSIKDIKKPWNQRLWKLGDKWYNLDEIEHKILRKMNEPRIHFAINCASFSCPPLLNEAFVSEKLEQQLTQVTKLFLADTKQNTITENQLEISKIFKWFAKDFKQNGSLIDFLNRYSNVKINIKAKKKYKDYNWDLNE